VPSPVLPRPRGCPGEILAKACFQKAFSSSDDVETPDTTSSRPRLGRSGRIDLPANHGGEPCLSGYAVATITLAPHPYQLAYPNPSPVSLERATASRLGLLPVQPPTTLLREAADFLVMKGTVGDRKTTSMQAVDRAGPATRRRRRRRSTLATAKSRWRLESKSTLIPAASHSAASFRARRSMSLNSGKSMPPLPMAAQPPVQHKQPPNAKQVPQSKT